MRWTNPNLLPGFALLATALLLPARGWPQSQSAATNGQGMSTATADGDARHLHGVVVDSRTGKPIARALVQGMGDRLATLTDQDGRFALDVRYTDPPVSDNAMHRTQAAQMMYLFLVARKPGYVSGQPFNQPSSMSSTDQDIELRLTPMAVIQGRVAAAGEDHPDGVRVSLFLRRVQNGVGQWGQMSAGSTNSRGEFRFSNLAPGDYKIATAMWSDQPQAAALADKPASRYAPVYYPVGSAAASGPSLHVSAGESVQVALNLHAEPFYPVRIPVAFPDGTTPAVQGRVLRDKAPTGFTLGYNSRDHALEGTLPDGVYEAVLESFGQEAYNAVAAITVAGSAVMAEPVTMLPAASIPVIVHQDFTQTQTAGAQSKGSRRSGSRAIDGVMAHDEIISNGEVSSLITADDIKHLAPLQLQLIPEEGTGRFFGLNQDRGGSDGLRVANVAPGTYRVEISSNEGYVAAATTGGTDLLRQPLVVSAGAGVQPIEVTLRDDTATVTGTVAPDALPAMATSLLFVFCLPSEPSAQRVQQIAINPGPFTWPNIPPGSYRVFASRKPVESLEYRSEAWMKRNASKGYPVTLEPGAAASVTLTTVLEEEP